MLGRSVFKKRFRRSQDGNHKHRIKALSSIYRKCLDPMDVVTTILMIKCGGHYVKTQVSIMLEKLKERGENQQQQSTMDSLK